MYSFCQYIPNSKLSSILDLNICMGRFSNWLTHILYFIVIYIFCSFLYCVWRMLTLARESCDFCWYSSESSSFLHRRACRNDESGHLSLGIAIWSFPCGFLYTLNAGSVIPFHDVILLSQKRASHFKKLPFSLSSSVCQIS